MRLPDQDKSKLIDSSVTIPRKDPDKFTSVIETPQGESKKYRHTHHTPHEGRYYRTG